VIGFEAMRRRLLGSLPRTFNRAGAGGLAFRWGYAGGAGEVVTWAVVDRLFTASVAGGGAVSLDLAARTVAEFSAWLDAQPGFWTDSLTGDGDLLTTSAGLVISGSGVVHAAYSYIDPEDYLLTESGDPLLTESGDPLYIEDARVIAVTGDVVSVIVDSGNLVRAFLSAFAQELSHASAVLVELFAQVSLATASEDWCDEHGDLYAVPRLSGESDPVYAARIISETLAPKANGVYIESQIQRVLGLSVGSVKVTDAPLHPSNSYGLFDVELAVGADYLVGHSLASVAEAALPVIDKLRDAGTHLRDFRAGVQSDAALYIGMAAHVNVVVTVYPE
jgi:hypothetical protein